MRTVTARIYDTDVGTDPDDTCVLIMAARDPALAATLVVTNDETTALDKARFGTQIAEAAGARYPVIAGLPSDKRRSDDLAARAGLVEPREVVTDAVERILAVLEAHDQVEYLGLGALTNLAAALDRRPELAARVRLTQMGPALANAHPRSKAQFNARIDPAAFRKVIYAVPRPLLVCSHTTWQLHPGGCPELGVFPADPLGCALAASPRADLRLMARHLDAFCAGDKACSIMHDPLTVLASVDPSLVDAIDVDVAIDDAGWMHLPDAARAAIAALPPDRRAPVDAALDAPPAPALPTTPVRLGLRADCERARRAILRCLVGEDTLAEAWRDHNVGRHVENP